MACHFSLSPLAFVLLSWIDAVGYFKAPFRMLLCHYNQQHEKTNKRIKSSAFYRLTFYIWVVSIAVYSAQQMITSLHLTNIGIIGSFTGDSPWPEDWAQWHTFGTPCMFPKVCHRAQSLGLFPLRSTLATRLRVRLFHCFIICVTFL